MIQELIRWLQGTSAHSVIQDVLWVIPVVQTVHILAISVVISSMAMLDVRLLGIAGRYGSIAAFTQRFTPWLWPALCVLLVSGLVLIIGEPERSLGNLTFQLKMGMLILAVVLTLNLQSVVRRDLAAGESDLAPKHALLGKATGMVSLGLWAGIVAAGRLIAYTGS